VIEPKAPPSLSNVLKIQAPDVRVFAITPASRLTLQRGSVWEQIESSGRISPFSKMQIWDALGKGSLNFNQENEFGWIIENRVLQSSLFDKLLEYSSTGNNVEIFSSHTVTSMSLPKEANYNLPSDLPSSSSLPAGSLASLTLSDSSVVQARLVVAADGSNSSLRSQANIGTFGWEYDKHAFVTTIQVSSDLMHTAFQRFLPNGPLAILPLWGNYASIVWTTTPEHAVYLKSLSSIELTQTLNRVLQASHEEFLDALLHRPSSNVAPASEQASLEYHAQFNPNKDVHFLNPSAALSKVFSSLTEVLVNRGSDPLRVPVVAEVVGQRASFPLKAMHANTYVKSRFALLGDSAHAVHPLGGQGLNLGIGDAAELSRVIMQEGMGVGADIGSLNLLRMYELNRRRDVAAMSAGLEFVEKSFSPTIFGHFFEAWPASRNLGLSMINAMGPLKEHISKFAMGSGE
jgi:ubiquinone biosynthesis monooxygenase Coq6